MNGWQLLTAGVTLVSIGGAAMMTVTRAGECFDQRRYWAGVGWALGTLLLYGALWLVGVMTFLMAWPYG